MKSGITLALAFSVGLAVAFQSTRGVAQETKSDAEIFRDQYVAFLDELETAASFLPAGFTVDPQASEGQQLLQQQLLDTEQSIHRAIAHGRDSLMTATSEELLQQRDFLQQHVPNWSHLPAVVSTAVNSELKSSLTSFAQRPYGPCEDGSNDCHIDAMVDIAVVFFADGSLAVTEDVAQVICVVKEGAWCAPKWVIQGIRFGLQTAFSERSFTLSGQRQKAIPDRTNANVTSRTNQADVGEQSDSLPAGSPGWCRRAASAVPCFTKDECPVGDFCLNVVAFPHFPTDPSPIPPTPAPPQAGECVTARPCTQNAECASNLCVPDHAPQEDVHAKLNAGLDAKITTRASEDSVGVRTGIPGEFINRNLHGKLDERLDVNALSRASQESVDGRTDCISDARSVRTVTDSIEFIKLPELEKAVDEALAMAKQQSALVRDFNELYTRIQLEMDLNENSANYRSAWFQLPQTAIGGQRAFCSRSLKVSCINPGPNLVLGTPGGISDDDYPDDSICPDKGTPADTCDLGSGYCSSGGATCARQRTPCTSNADCSVSETCETTVHHCNLNPSISCTNDGMCPAAVEPEVCVPAARDRGFLDELDAVVTQSIQMVQAAGEDPHKAQHYLQLAQRWVSTGDHKRAYLSYRKAYREAAKMGGNGH